MLLESGLLDPADDAVVGMGMLYDPMQVTRVQGSTAGWWYSCRWGGRWYRCQRSTDQGTIGGVGHHRACSGRHRRDRCRGCRGQPGPRGGVGACWIRHGQAKLQARRARASQPASQPAREPKNSINQYIKIQRADRGDVHALGLGGEPSATRHQASVVSWGWLLRTVVASVARNRAGVR